MGQILVLLDETDYRIALEHAKAALGQTIRQVTQMLENVYALASMYEVRQSELLKPRNINYVDRKAVVKRIRGPFLMKSLSTRKRNYYAAKIGFEQK